MKGLKYYILAFPHIILIIFSAKCSLFVIFLESSNSQDKLTKRHYKEIVKTKINHGNLNVNWSEEKEKQHQIPIVQETTQKKKNKQEIPTKQIQLKQNVQKKKNKNKKI
ncbi:hypothetical protein RFI_03937 [Reticulomyxa filosa]|uniref:Uncharacterized protein n=1 Tax=Reticulomyxa filosa TaxID=46433 RepID=X6P4N8_RETFI|nr:hypothetical protein RFI_03937 [Reticulomyxa filosa]|eukprot:ETO33171.1 hypothetical protein RFI_03937 [Reticulomyxa filosa]